MLLYELIFSCTLSIKFRHAYMTVTRYLLNLGLYCMHIAIYAIIFDTIIIAFYFKRKKSCIITLHKNDDSGIAIRCKFNLYNKTCTLADTLIIYVIDMHVSSKMN